MKRIKNIYLGVFSNRRRLYRTITGIMLASVLFLTGLVFVNTYVQKLYQEAYLFPSQSIMISGAIDDQLLEDIEQTIDETERGIFYDGILLDADRYTWEGMTLNVMPNLIGTDMGFTRTAIPSSMYEDGAFYTSLIKGRNINNEDILFKRRVVIISEMAEQILFGTESAIGKNILLHITQNKVEEYTVIGVYENSLDEQYFYDKLENAMKHDVTDVNILNNYYIPYTVLEEYQDYFTASCSSVVYDGSTVMNAKELIIGRYSNTDSVNLVYLEEKIKAIDEMSLDMQRILRAVYVLIMIIAGLNMLNCSLFSIQERMEEIGIRKAVGAESHDIGIQFEVEGIIIALLGACASCIIVTIGVIAVQILLYQYSSTDINLVLNINMLLETICYCVLMGLIVNVIPAIKAARIQVVDAIRF